MVRLFVMLAFALLYCASAAAAVQIKLHADKSRIRLGEPWTVTLQVDDAHEPLSTISLDRVKQLFNIYSATGSSERRRVRGHPQVFETMVLVLYPLHAGNLQLPALEYHGAKSRPLPVRVDAQDASVSFRASLDVPHPVVRQPAMLTLEIRDEGTLQWAVPHDLKVAGAYLHWQGEGQREETLAGKRYTVHSYLWDILPLRDGVMEVEFPLLDAFMLGSRLRYPLEKLQSYVAPVPAYLPVHVPVGKPEVSTAPLPDEIAVGRPYNWQLTIRHGGLNAEALRKLLPVFNSNDGVKFYPLQFEAGAGVQNEAGQQVIRVIIPLVAQRSGVLSLPEIRLPYYDLGLARVESVEMPAPGLNAYSPFWRMVRRVAAGLLVAGLLGWGGYRFAQLLRCMRRKHHLLKSIRNARDAVTLHRLLLQVAAGVAAQTLQQWLAGMQGRAANGRLLVLVQQLEQVLYGRNDQAADIGRLAADFASALQRKKCRLFSSP